MLAKIKWNLRNNARNWMKMVDALVAQLSILNTLRRKIERRSGPPLWKHFDDTHHWDSAAEEWIPND
jgi:hypothetical protein